MDYYLCDDMYFATQDNKIYIRAFGKWIRLHGDSSIRLFGWDLDKAQKVNRLTALVLFGKENFDGLEGIL